MNLELIDKFIEFNKDYNILRELYFKYSVASYYRKLILFFSNDSNVVDKNIEFVIGEISKIGYTIPKCNDYNELLIQLNLIIDDMNNQVQDLFSKKILDSTLESKIKDMFNI